jgi:hypothetical protein
MDTLLFKIVTLISLLASCANGFKLYLGYEYRNDEGYAMKSANAYNQPMPYSTHKSYEKVSSQKKEKTHEKKSKFVANNISYKMYNDDGYKTLEDRYSKYGNKYMY